MDTVATAASALSPPPAPSPAAGADGVAERLEAVRERVATAAKRAGRAPGDVLLVAVSKGMPTQAIVAARDGGHADFGESRVQELSAKRAAVHPGVRWHFVGRLQRNKVKELLGGGPGAVAVVHSVDRAELAEAIARHARESGTVQRVLLQVNAGGDPAKGGCAPAEAAALLSRMRDLDGLVCEGLMTVPPLGQDPRPVFRALRGLRDDLRERFEEVRHLSMGMSADFEPAIEEGATIVRVGGAIFGPRPPGPTQYPQPEPSQA